MITVTFLNGCILATAEQSLWQYSYNQQLQINGLELPGVFTVDFCNEGDTTTVAMIGSSGVVDIPNELLTSGRNIVAYVFQKSALTGGITRCEIRIDVLTRPERDDETPTPEQEAVIDQYIAELNEGVEQAETAAANAQTSENNAAASAADAQQSKADAAASASAAAGSASDASNSAAAAAQSAVNASNSAENAAEAASEGIGYKEDSEAWAIGKRGGVDVGSSDETYHNNSKYYAGQAAASSSAANSEAAAAAQSARDAAASENGAAQSAASATASKNAATNSADVAANAATAAQNHAISAASSATAASGSATAAANKATAAAQSATAAGNSATEAATAREAAEDAQDAAEAASQSIAQSAAQIAQNTSDIADLQDAVDTLQPAATAADVGKALIVKTVAGGKPTEYEYGEAGGGGDAAKYAPIIINSASGDIASFADGADDLPVKALSVNVEPIQDLHGYDSPWPAGGGVNKIDVNQLVTYGTTYGLTTSFDGDWIVFSGEYTNTNQASNYRIATLRDTSVFPVTKFKAFPDSNTSSHITSTSFGLADGNKTLTIRISGMVQGETYNLRCKIVGYEGDTAPTEWTPYSNICPISGRTSATVTRTGKNLVDANTVWATFLQPDGTFYHPLWNVHFYIPQELVGKQLTFSAYAKADANNAKLRVCAVIGGASWNGNFINNTSEFSLTQLTFTPTSTSDYIVLQNSGVNGTYKSIQLELGPTASAYEPYAGTTYTIALGDTVYGGTLDVTGGKMMVTDANIASYAGESLPSTWISDIDVYAEGTTPTTGAQVVYKLATPIEITLTPTQINTLLGTNNIWSDAGAVDVDYCADTKLYIDNIHTPTEDDMTADAQIASGKYFLIGGNLYRSTTTIPAGDTIRPGTNCVKTNLAEALNALNA